MPAAIHQTLSTAMDIFKLSLQVGLLALLVYGAMVFLRGTRAALILTGIILTTILGWGLAELLQLDVLKELLSQVPALLAFALVIIFQPEIRSAFAAIGSNPQKLFRERHSAAEVIDALVEAAFFLKERHIGALIVVERDIPMKSLAESGIAIDAPVSAKLLQTLFFKGTPMHDGAVLVKDGMIVAASCFITKLTEHSLDSDLGTRHRAGIGLTEESDALTVIVSEETGQVGLASRGLLVRNTDKQRLRRHLTNYLIKQNDRDKRRMDPSLIKTNVDALKSRVMDETKDSGTEFKA
jgi:diadenylate cyclase